MMRAKLHLLHAVPVDQRTDGAWRRLYAKWFGGRIPAPPPADHAR
jgi:hypothetical protein